MPSVRIHVRHHLGDLSADLLRIHKEAPAQINSVVRDGVKAGTVLAKDFATATSRKHAKKYPATMSPQMNRPRRSLFGGTFYSGEYGPQPRGQGLLGSILENGSRNNPAHLNLARSADIIGRQFPREVGDALDRLFW